MINKKTIIVTFTISVILGVMLYIFNATILTIVIWETIYILGISIIYITYAVSQDKISLNKKTSKKDILLLTTEEAEDFCYKKLAEEGVIIRKILKKNHISIPSDIIEKSPTHFFYMLVEDKFDNEYKLISVNLKNLQYNLLREQVEPSDDYIYHILNRSSENQRELSPVTKQYDDPERGKVYETSYRPVRRRWVKHDTIKK